MKLEWGRESLLYFSSVMNNELFKSVETRINELALPIIHGLGGFLVETQVRPNKITLEFDKPGGVTIEDCTHVSKALSDHELLADVFEKHELEVSSPGMEKPFRVPEQFKKNTGKNIRVLTKEGKVIVGKLLDFSGNGILLSVPGEKKGTTIEQPYSIEEIKETKIHFTF